jgi:hypothetical protein
MKNLPAKNMANLQELIEEHKATAKQESELWAEATKLRAQYDALERQNQKLHDKIGDLFWKSLKEGMILTNGKQEVTIKWKWDKIDVFDLRKVEVEPPANLDGPRKELYKNWLHPLDGYATNQGWRIKN